LRRPRVAQACGGSGVDTTLRGERHAVIALRLLARDESVGDVGGDEIGIALARVAEAAAAGQLEPCHVARRHGLAALRADRPAGGEGDFAERAGSTAVASARRIADALEIAQQADRRAVGAAELDDLAEPAALPAGAARALAELAAEEHRGNDFCRLDRNGAHPARESGDAEPVLLRPRAGAAAMEDDRAELRQ